MPAYISEGPDRTAQLKYTEGGSSFTRIWEQLDGKYLLETLFSHDGAVLDQSILQSDKQPMSFAKQFIDGIHTETVEVAYGEVKLDKSCPKCSGSIHRVAKAGMKVTDIPIMPLYMCAECSSKCYYLTEEYLNHLVSRKESLFLDTEIALYKTDTESFINDLKQYINRIFAAKHIYEIK